MGRLRSRATLFALLTSSWSWSVFADDTPDKAARPRLHLLRSEDDSRFLRDPDSRTLPLDSIRHIEPFGSESKPSDIYASFGANARLSYELFVNEGYGSVPQDDTGSLLLRGLVHSDLWLTQHVRTFVQLNTAHEAGRDGGPTPIDKDVVDLHQGFVQLSIGDPRANPSPTGVDDFDASPFAHASLSLRLGRQELKYGAGRLIDLRNGPNIRRSFDGALMKFKTQDIELDGLFAREVNVHPDAFDSGLLARASLFGAHLTLNESVLPHQTLESYVFGTEREELAYETAIGDERRWMGGVRHLFHWNGFENDIEVTYQWGTLDQITPLFSPQEHASLRIRAWGIASSISKRLKLPWTPELRLSSGYTSGDTDRSDSKLGTYRSPFPDLRFAGATTRIGPGNLWGVSPSLSFSPVPPVLISGGARFFFRSTTEDAVYNPIGFPNRSAPISNKRFVGTGAYLLLVGFLHEYANVYAMCEMFAPGSFVKDAPPAETSYWFTSGAELQF